MYQLEQMLEDYPNTYDPAGNGEIEATLKQVTIILRANKLDLEKHIQKEVPLNHPVMDWLMEYSAPVINIRAVGADSAMAFERVRRRRSTSDT